MIKKYWWVIGIVVVVVLYFGYRATQGGMGYSSTLPTSTIMPSQTTSGVPAPSGNIYTTRTDPTKGSYIADFQGMSLYVSDNDSAGTSNCSGTCAATWRPYTSGATAESNLPANITVITRTDGSMQFAWMGKPLYYNVSDQNPGDTLGDGVGGIWHLVKP